MTGCVAKGCTNSSGKGFLMKKVPKKLERRQLWLQAVNRLDLINSEAAKICEVHFDLSSWDKIREDGSRKLKDTAVPTLFLDQQKGADTDEAKLENKKDQNMEHSVKKDEFSEPFHMEFDTSEEAADMHPFKVINTRKVRGSQIQQYQVSLQRSRMTRLNLRRKLRLAKAKIRKLESLGGDAAFLQNIFNADQIKFLKNKYKKFHKWSNETIKKAMRLKQACGKMGYRELLRQKLPLPSLKTLSRRVGKFSGEEKLDVLQFVDDGSETEDHREEFFVLNEKSLMEIPVQNETIVLNECLKIIAMDHDYLSDISLRKLASCM